MQTSRKESSNRRHEQTNDVLSARKTYRERRCGTRLQYSCQQVMLI